MYKYRALSLSLSAESLCKYICRMYINSINSIIPINFRWSAYIIFVFPFQFIIRHTHTYVWYRFFFPFWSCLMLLFSLRERLKINCLFKCFGLRHRARLNLHRHFHFCYLSYCLSFPLISLNVMYRLRIIVCLYSLHTLRSTCISAPIFIFIYCSCRLL